MVRSWDRMDFALPTWVKTCFNLDTKYFEQCIFKFQIKVVKFEEDHQLSYLDFRFRSLLGSSEFKI